MQVPRAVYTIEVLCRMDAAIHCMTQGGDDTWGAQAGGGYMHSDGEVLLRDTDA